MEVVLDEAPRNSYFYHFEVDTQDSVDIKPIAENDTLLFTYDCGNGKNSTILLRFIQSTLHSGRIEVRVRTKQEDNHVWLERYGRKMEITMRTEGNLRNQFL